MIEWTNTSRGFRKGEFKDRYDITCSIQESSLATEECIWLGRADDQVYEGGGPAGSRMHLTREMAGQLAQILLKFSYTGEL